MKKADIHKMRQNYGKGKLELSELVSQPLNQFKTWFDQAVEADQTEPNAMILSTIDDQNRPSGRTVLMKQLTAEGIAFYTNLESDKAIHIAQNNQVAATFLWLSMERQVRINGTTIPIDDDTATAYFQSRPKASQIGAWASSQSKVIVNREELNEKVKAIEAQYKNDNVLPKPPFWGGYLIVPQSIEFWQGRRNRLHDRFRYEKTENNKWRIVRLSP